MKRIAKSVLVILISAVATVWSGAALAQGSIFGTVENADGSSPAAFDLLWCGFLDDTDEEIRIESNTGAGYDGMYWFDDFQNFTTEAAGNPYDYYFTNMANSESYHLTGLIPDSSYQQEDIVLATASIPVRPEMVAASAISSAEIIVRWQQVDGLTYHVYRRNTSNNGVFRRVDDPSGDLSNRGVADSLFVDGTSDGSSNYTYLIIGEDGAGNLSPHSEESSVDAADWCNCGVWGDLNGDEAINAVDVVYIVNYVYKNQDSRVQPANCPLEAGNVDCDGIINPVEVVFYINYVYKNQPDAFCLDPCSP